ncbi:MAG: EamA family transporter [Verrucomicrobiota bacterium]
MEGTQPQAQRWRGIGLVLTSGSCWGFHGILIKYAFGLGASFIQVFLVEVLFATVFFLFFAKRFFDPVRPRTMGEWLQLSAIGGATIGVGSFLFLSFSLGPVAIAATLMFLYLPVVYGVSVAMGHQSFSLTKLSAIALILLGAVFTTELLSTFREPGILAAAGAAVGAAASYAMVFILTPRVAGYTTLYFRSFTVSGIGLLGCLVILAINPGLWFELGDNGMKFALFAILLGVIGQTLPVVTLMKGLPITGGSLGGVLASVELPIAVFSSALLLGESLNLLKVVGVVLVLGGIIAYNFADRLHPSDGNSLVEI